MEAMCYKVSRTKQKRWALRKDLKSDRGDLRCPVAEGSNNFGAAKAPSPLRCHLVFGTLNSNCSAHLREWVGACDLRNIGWGKTI